MKPTTKIIIALLALPFVVEAVGAGVIALLGSRNNSNVEIEAVTYSSVDLQEFQQVNFEFGENVWLSNDTLDINCDSAFSLRFPDEWKDYFNYSVEDGCLTFSFRNPNKGMAVLSNGSFTISSPNITDISTPRPYYELRCNLSGFKQRDISIKSQHSWKLEDCNIDSIHIEPSDVLDVNIALTFDDSYTQTVDAKAFSFVDFFSSGTGRIDNCSWHPDSLQTGTFKFGVNKVNLGKLQWYPANENQKLDLKSSQQTSCTFQK